MNSPKISRSAAKHQELYKSPSGRRGPAIAEYTSDSNNNQSPSWRNVYKKRCFDEFKKSRQKLVNRFRSLDMGTKDQKSARDYLEEELQKICLLEASTKPELKISVDEAIDIYKQIQKELIPTSFAEYNDDELSEILKQEEMQELGHQEAISNNSETYVICPLCQKTNLITNGSIIRCNSCDFHVDSSMMDLNSLGERLSTAISHHECNNHPIFQYKTNIQSGSQDAAFLKQLSGSTNSSFLLMSCDNCNFMEFIF